MRKKYGHQNKSGYLIIGLLDAAVALISFWLDGIQMSLSLPIFVSMKNVWYKFLYILAFTFYVVSALEVNDFGIKNTFFDQYDSYIESSQQDIQPVVSQERDKDDCPPVFQTFQSISLLSSELKREVLSLQKLLTQKYIQRHQGRKIFIFHSVWII
ncbi:MULTISPECIES: hypothetical protein [Dyadobacter]|uniref:Uncharacterized protein n=1 Tax=Dyadobacter psychrotolerans TaxID=2541721 RepID=A0A4R5DGY0_9BACT|nr:hypothetical protein [Dyadobacter psychrotolerans]TDE13266.1 hypothetical protein E0F88_19655 [Dyadobacter psychrotolerans]